MSSAGDTLREMLTAGVQSFSVCPVCAGDRRICKHEADEWYDAILLETRRQLNSYIEGYARLLAWHQQKRHERGEMKRRIKELEAQNLRLLRRLHALQEERG